MKRVNRARPILSEKSIRRFHAEVERQAKVDAKFLAIGEVRRGGAGSQGDKVSAPLEGQPGRQAVHSPQKKEDQVDATYMDRHDS